MSEYNEGPNPIQSRFPSVRKRCRFCMQFEGVVGGCGCCWVLARAFERQVSTTRDLLQTNLLHLTI